MLGGSFGAAIFQLTFRLEDLATLRRVQQRLVAEGNTNFIPLNHGNSWSLYTRDPEGNALEFVVDSPWFIHQPFGEFLDLALDDAEILRQTEEICRAHRRLAAVRRVAREDRASDRRRSGPAALAVRTMRRIETPGARRRRRSGRDDGALLLSRLGIPSRIIERRAAPQSAPAAHVVNARTFEIFRAAGVDMQAIAAACQDPADAGQVLWVTTLAGEELGRLPFERQGDDALAFTPTPLRNLSQHRLEPILLDASSALRERRHRATGTSGRAPSRTARA